MEKNYWSQKFINSMSKYFFPIVILTLLLCSISFSELHNNRFYDEEYKFEVKAPGDWDADLTRKGKRIAFSRNDRITEATVEVLPLGPCAPPSGRIVACGTE